MSISGLNLRKSEQLATDINSVMLSSQNPEFQVDPKIFIFFMLCAYCQIFEFGKFEDITLMKLDIFSNLNPLNTTLSSENHSGAS
mgnify:CR=1 FL=1